MRYYSITLTPPMQGSTNFAATAPAVGSVVGGLTNIATVTSTAGPYSKQWTSFPNGVNDPGALDVEFDFFSAPGATPMSTGSTITIHGISLTDLKQAANFVDMYAVVSGGMQAGLPLANPKQAGIILQGKIIQSFGNWVGTDMSLTLVVYAGAYTVNRPGQIILNWPAGSSLWSALTTCLKIAYPNAQLPTAQTIGNQYVNSHQVLACYPTFEQLAAQVKSFTAAQSPPGVDIILQPDGSITIRDGSVQTGITKISFLDLIGQPTWLDINTMAFITPMRGDIQVGNTITMPPGLVSSPGLVTTLQVPGRQVDYTTTFQGDFIVQAVRQIGNFRDPNGQAWSTVFQAAPFPNLNPSGSTNLVTGGIAGPV